MNYIIQSNEHLHMNDEDFSPPKITNEDSFSQQNQRKNKKSVAISNKKTKTIAKSNSFLNISISPKKKQPNNHCIIDIRGAGKNNSYRNDVENYNSFNKYLNHAKEGEILKKNSLNFPIHITNFKKIQSMMGKIEGKNQNLQILETLEKKTQEIENLLNAQQDDCQLHTMKLALSIVLHLLDPLKYHLNLEISKLQQEKSRFYNFWKDFEVKYKNYPESGSITVFFEKILKLLENYMLGCKTQDVVLTIGSLDDLKFIDGSTKITSSNTFIESPDELKLNKRIKKNEKYKNLKVQTKNLEDFRYIGQKSQTIQKSTGSFESCFINAFQENSDIILAVSVALFLTLVVIFVVLFIFVI